MAAAFDRQHAIDTIAHLLVRLHGEIHCTTVALDLDGCECASHDSIRLCDDIVHLPEADDLCEFLQELDARLYELQEDSDPEIDARANAIFDAEARAPRGVA